MADDPRDFAELEEAVRRFRDARDWRQFHRPRDLAASVCIEAAELLEHFQWKSDVEAEVYAREASNRRAIAAEMADVQLLLISMADVLGVDLHQAALDKLATNERKYPVSKSRGRATKYDAL